MKQRPTNNSQSTLDIILDQLEKIKEFQNMMSIDVTARLSHTDSLIENLLDKEIHNSEDYFKDLRQDFTPPKNEVDNTPYLENENESLQISLKITEKIAIGCFLLMSIFFFVALIEAVVLIS